MKFGINFKRLGLLLKIDFLTDWQRYLLPGMVVFLVYLFVSLVSGFFSHSPQIPFEPYFAILLFIGMILTSTVLKQVHNMQDAVAFYMLPASIGEKLLSKAILSFAGYFVFSVLVGIFATIITSTVNYLLFRFPFVVFNPFNQYFIYGLFTYLTAHALFFLASALWKRAPFFTMLLAGFIVNISLFIIAGLAMWLLFGKTSVAFNPADLQQLLQRINPSLPERLPRIFSIAVWASVGLSLVFSGLFYATAYQKVREIQIKD